MREEFAKMIELTETIPISYETQTRVSDKSIVDGLEGTFIREYNLLACPQTMV